MRTETRVTLYVALNCTLLVLLWCSVDHCIGGVVDPLRLWALFNDLLITHYIQCSIVS